MQPTSAPTAKPSVHASQADENGAGADALFTWLTQLKAEENAEDDPSRYASPPCYLAEFSEDFEDHPARS